MSEHGMFSPGNNAGIDPAWTDIDALADTVREGLDLCDCFPRGAHERRVALDALAERAKQAEAERDEARRTADGMARAPYGEFEAMRERADAAEAAVERLSEALRQIAQGDAA
jgi:hypothetical protein